MMDVMVGIPAGASREFRTLVTSIRGPIEDELADRAGLPAARRERLKSLHRNVMQLLQLVNTLFDLSASESFQRPGNGRVDLAAKTIVIPALRGGELVANEDRVADPQDDDGDGAASAAELQRANQELEAFSYSVSHDLRGPLRAVNGFSQVLLKEYAHALDRNGRELLEQIHVSAERMGAIIDDLLSLSHVGRAELHREPIDLTMIARRVVSNLRLREPSRSVEIRLTDGLTASCDGRLVTIALENLFSNAWKFTGKRSQAQIAFDREDGGVFAVHDDGAGFDMTRGERLFEPFHRLHSASDFEGTGIGLAIVRRVIERHGGRVWAHGVVDRGATLRFTLEPTGS
jgi:signal transduction histidine kinase